MHWTWLTWVRLDTEELSWPGSTARTETDGECLARKPVHPPGAAPTSTTRRGPDWNRRRVSSTERSCRASAILSSALLKLSWNVGSLSPSPGLEMASLYWPAVYSPQPTLSSDTKTATKTWLNPVGLQEILWLEK